MTTEEFTYYSNIARRMFDFMNGKINPINICQLEIALYGNQPRMFGDFQNPNRVHLFMENIIDDWKPEFYDNYEVTKYDYTCNLIALTICHELFHSEQVMDTARYKDDKDYYDSIETAVKIEALNWIENSGINKVFHFKICIEDFGKDVPYEYQQLDEIDDFYYQILVNAVERVSMKSEIADNIYDYLFSINVHNVIIGFIDTNNGIDCNNYSMKSLVIKQNNEFLYSAFTDFCNLVYENTARFTKYELADLFDYNSNTNTSTLRFLVKNQIIEPVIFLNK